MPFKSAELIKKLEKLGFVQKRQAGSHLIMYKTGYQPIIIPVHKGKDVSSGVERQILKILDMSLAELKNIK